MDSISGSRSLFFNNGVTTACFITAGNVEDSIDRFTMHVNTGVSVAMFDLSKVAEIMSMSDESLLVPFITGLQMSLHVAS